eukprot:6550453-Karenia_brevis.AAC.1
MTLTADNIDDYPEYHSVVHGTNHRSAVSIQQQQRISKSPYDESHITGAHHQKPIHIFFNLYQWCKDGRQAALSGSGSILLGDVELTGYL